MPSNPRPGKKTCCPITISAPQPRARGGNFGGPGLCGALLALRRASSVPAMFQLDDLNTCAPDAFAAALGEIFEHSPWVAQAAGPRRPFPTVAALHDAMMAVIRAAPADRKLAFLQAHPELGSK